MYVHFQVFWLIDYSRDWDIYLPQSHGDFVSDFYCLYDFYLAMGYKSLYSPASCI